MPEDNYVKMQDPESGSRSAAARSAFANKDAESSKQVHQQQAAHKEPTNPEGKYLKPVIFGGLDGISTIFGFLAGAVGADLSLVSIIALGIAQLFAGAFGMGVGEYLSSEAERQVALREEEREHWEVEQYPEGEISEMISIYKDKGLSEEDAVLVANTLSKYKDFWVEHMMLTEIGMMPADGDQKEAIVQGLLMFSSFFLLGAIPLIAYIVMLVTDENVSKGTAMAVACGASVLSLSILGIVKAYLADLSLVKGAAQMAVQGLMSAAGAYLIGNSLPEWLKEELGVTHSSDHPKCS